MRFIVDRGQFRSNRNQLLKNIFQLKGHLPTWEVPYFSKNFVKISEILQIFLPGFF